MTTREQERITAHGLFADIRGEPGAAPLLFLHGGPGQGCYDFMALQGDRLAGTCRVFGLDQRGVDRSAPLPEGAALTIADLVADCEEARRALGIERWAVLGHSFGGMLALRYAARHPGAVTAVIFENPVLDIAAACRAALPRSAALLADLGRGEQARAAVAALDGGRPPRELYGAHRAALAALGEHREVYYIPEPATRRRLRAVRDARPRAGAGAPGPDEQSTTRHFLAITGDDAFYQPLPGLLPALAAPALLITGGRDPVATGELRAAFAAAPPAAQLREFPGAGHFAHADDPAAYAATVTGFLRGLP